MASLTGRTLSRYHLLEEIGRGGMSTVYKSYDPAQDEHVAIKVLSPGMAENEQFSRRFRREANLVLQLRHARVVPVTDFGEQDGYAYLVMPYLDVGSLTDRMAERPLSLPEIARIIDHITDALEFAHRKGVVHRDVKPSNILIDDSGRALLSDFGLARIHDASMSLTGSALIGTPTFMSPEQAQGTEVDGRSDQYSLGVILYELITGQPPFEGETPVAVLIKHINDPLPLPRTVNPDVPEAIERVILKATAKNPEDRFPSVREMNSAFQAAVAHTLDPEANPKPNLSLMMASGSASSQSGKPTLALPKGRWVRPTSILASLVFLLLAVPVAISTIVGLFEDAANPAQSSGPRPIELGMEQVTALAATLDAVSGGLVSPTATATLTPTATPIPTISENFSGARSIFSSIEGSEVRDGSLFLGPFDHCAADEAFFDEPIGCSVVCLTCGTELANFELDLELTFVQGISDADYGIILRVIDEDQDGLFDREDYMLAIGFNTFHNRWSVYLHKADRVYPWSVVRTGQAGLRPANRLNRLQVLASNNGRLIDVFLNDFRIVKLTADPPNPGEVFIDSWVERGAVGLLVLNDRVMARYDNFLLRPFP